MKFLTLSFLALYFVSRQPVMAQQSIDITLQVDVSVCGNSVVETPAEDCEGTDLNSATCASLGYSSGTLACDQACSFDPSACVSPSPTPTPSPTTTTPSPVPPSSPPPALPVITTLARLPSTLKSLLASVVPTATELTTTHLRPLLQTWVESYRALPNIAAVSSPTLARCDINKDETCNLTDLSVILFYVQP